MNWLLFAIVGGVIIVSGSRLSLYADILALKFKLSRSAMGALLVSIITSLPEVTTTLGSICTVDSPDMALGNIFGSVLFNLSIIGICDLIFRQGGIFRHIHKRELRPAVGSLIIIVIAAIGLVATIPLSLGGLNFGLGSVLVIVTYVGFFVWIHKTGMLAEIIETESSAQTVSTWAAVIGFAICSVIIVASGIYLAVLGDKIVQSSGLSHSFMGALFLAIATSLPELTVGISAVRRGSFDLLMGTVMGSNMFNILIVAFADLFYLKEALNVPANLGWSQIFGAGCGIVATTIAITGILKSSKKRARLIGWRSAAIMLIHLICLMVIFKGWL